MFCKPFDPEVLLKKVYLTVACTLLFILVYFSLAEQASADINTTDSSPVYFSEVKDFMPFSESLQRDIELLVRQYYPEPETSSQLSYEQALGMHVAVTRQMSLLRQSLANNIKEDETRGEKDRHYILASSFSAFMYMMTAVGDFAIANDISDVQFASIRELMHLLIEQGLVNDHPSFGEMMSTLHTIHIEQVDGDLKMTLTNQKNKDVKVKFKQGIPSPRFVIYAVMIDNGATFIFSDLSDEKHKSERDAFVKDTQRNLISSGGFILMDERKDNIPLFVENYVAQTQHASEDRLKPLLITGKGFAGKGHIKGLKLPSPTTQLDSIYLLPGRDGSPAFVRAKTLGFSAFVAL
jgi:hypothetical protein